MGTSATKAKNKYAEKNYERIALVVKKGEKEKIRAAAEQHGMSLNAYIAEAIQEKMSRDENEY